MIKGLLYKLLLITLGCSLPVGAVLTYHHFSKNETEARISARPVSDHRINSSAPTAAPASSPSAGGVSSTTPSTAKSIPRKQDSRKREESSIPGEASTSRGDISSVSPFSTGSTFPASNTSGSLTPASLSGLPKTSSAPLPIPRSGGEVTPPPSPLAGGTNEGVPLLGGSSPSGVSPLPLRGIGTGGSPVALMAGGTEENPSRQGGSPSFANVGGNSPSGGGSSSKSSGSSRDAPGEGVGNSPSGPPGQGLGHGEKKSKGPDPSNGSSAQMKVINGQGSGVGWGGDTLGSITPMSATLPPGRGPNLGNGMPNALTVLNGNLPEDRIPIAHAEVLTSPVLEAAPTQGFTMPPTPLRAVSVIQSPQLQNLQVADSSVPPMRVGLEAQVVKIPIIVSVILPNTGVTCENLKQAKEDPQFQHQVFLGETKISLWYDTDKSGRFDTEEYWDLARLEPGGPNTEGCEIGIQGDQSTNLSNHHYTWAKIAVTYKEHSDTGDIIYTADPQIVSCDQGTPVCFQLNAPPNKAQVVADQKASLNLQNSGGDPSPLEAVPVSALTLDSANSENVIRAVESGMVEIKGQMINSLQFLIPLAN